MVTFQGLQLTQNSKHLVQRVRTGAKAAGILQASIGAQAMKVWEDTSFFKDLAYQLGQHKILACFATDDKTIIPRPYRVCNTLAPTLLVDHSFYNVLEAKLIAGLLGPQPSHLHTGKDVTQ